MNSRTRKPVRINMSQLRSAKILHGLQTLSQQVRKKGVKIPSKLEQLFWFRLGKTEKKGA